MRRFEDDLWPVARASRPGSRWRIAAPLLLLALLVPSFVLAYACVTDQGPWAADGYFGPGNLATTLVLLSPLVVWGAGWLWAWEGEPDILEPRAVVCAIAGGIGLAVCALCAVDLYLAELGNALA